MAKIQINIDSVPVQFCRERRYRGSKLRSVKGFTMDEERKRKRVDDGVRRPIISEQNSKTVEAAAMAVEEKEIDEFFAILRRMQVAVKYFQKNKPEVSCGGESHQLTETCKTPLEVDVPEGADAVREGDDGVNRASAVGAFDLNVAPEVEGE